MGLLVEDDGVGEHRARVDADVAGKLDAVAEDAFVGYRAVVADVRLGHDEAFVADAGGTALVDAAVDDDMLADGDFVAGDAVGAGALPAEILRVGADDGTLVNFVVGAEACAAENGGVRHYFAAVADLDILVDVCEGVDCDVFADFCRRVDVCSVAYHGCKGK